MSRSDDPPINHHKEDVFVIIMVYSWHHINIGFDLIQFNGSKQSFCFERESSRMTALVMI